MVEEIAPGVRLVRAPNPSPMTERGTNTWLVGAREIAVIDPGPDDPAHLAAIRAATAGARISHILVTHAHRDHSALAPRLARATGAPVLAYGTATEGRAPEMARLAAEGRAEGGEGVDGAFVPDRRLADGAVVAGADWRLVALHTPGHMAGHLSFALDDAVFTGDHVMGWASSLVSPPDGDVAAFLAACRRLATRADRIFLPGHGDPVTDPAGRLAWLIAHREARRAALLDALADGPARIPALVSRLYADTPPALHPAAARNVFAHLVDLVASGLAEATPTLAPDALYSLARSASLPSGRP